MTIGVLLIAGILSMGSPGTPPPVLMQAPAQTETQAPAASAPQSQPAADEAAIRVLLKKQAADWNRGDVRAFMQGYWNSPHTEFVGSDGILRGWQTVMARYRKTYPDRTAMGRLTFSELEVSLLGPEAALVVGHWHLKRANDAPEGVFTLVFKKFPEGWRIVNDHTSQTARP